ncbi:MAG TPA: SDR family oxidoreductase [Micromonosporaceae bacterium]
MRIGLHGKRVLLTGGSRGIGLATTLALVSAGAKVMVCCRDPAAMPTIVDSNNGQEPGELQVVAADVRSTADVSRLAARCAEEFGGLDVLVSNVGVDGVRPLSDLDDDEWDRMLGTNLTAAYLVTSKVTPLLAAGASVVYVGASAAARGRPGAAHYCAAKTGLTGLARSLAKELGPRGIRVNVVAPGVVVGEDSGPPPPVRAALTAATALGRLATPEDVAGSVLFLASDLSRCVSGTTLSVDGGV